MQPPGIPVAPSLRTPQPLVPQRDQRIVHDGRSWEQFKSIEVVFTSGGVDKLARYQALGVPEVWLWQDGVLRVSHLRSQGYEGCDRSELEGLNDLDLDLLRQSVLMAETDTGAAICQFQQAIAVQPT